MTDRWSVETLRQLRAALQAGDSTALVALLSGRPLADVLHLAGDAVAGAVHSGSPGTADLAKRYIAALRERGWEGDRDLAEQLGAVSEREPMPPLMALQVDLEELSGLLEGDPVFGGGRIDLTTGECRPRQVDDGTWENEEDEDLDRWLPVPCEGSRDGYRDMELFITTVADAGFADRLAIAIAGRGAFHRFRAVLARNADEQYRFHLFSDERRRGRARAWLAAHGYRPAFRH